MNTMLGRQFVPILLLVGCARALSEEGGRDTSPASFSRSPSDIVLLVSWSDPRTLRKWSRTYFGDSRVEASDIAADGQPLEPGASWFLDDGRLESALAAAVESGLGSSSQESLMGRIREVGRHTDAAEDEITLTVELHMLVGDSKGDELRPETRVFRIKDPLGLARRFPEIRELGGLASLYQLARESRTQ